jgi:hypothetical protein
LDIVDEDFLSANPPTGFLPNAFILGLLDSHYQWLTFHCDSGDYYFNVTYRSGTSLVHLNLVEDIDADGSISFGLQLASGMLVVVMFSHESQTPRGHIYSQVSAIVSVEINGPFRPASPFLGVKGISYFRSFALSPVDSSSPH